MHGLIAQWHGYGWDMGPGMMGWGMSWFWHILMIAFWIAVVVAIVLLIRWLIISARGGSQSAKREDSASEILRQRYARGEINKEKFEEKKKDLASQG